MGCSICLEPYVDEANKGRRPVALPCGHIYHKECSDGWLKSCRMRNDPACCPLCKTQLGTARAISLWPGDIRDLDQYLAHRNRLVDYQRTRHEPRAALDRYMSRELQGDLLAKLMDFRQHVSAYVMAVNNVGMLPQGTEDRTFKLFREVVKDEDKASAFEASMESLSTAASILNESIGTIEEMRLETEVKNARAKEEYARMEERKAALDRHMLIKAQEEQDMHSERSRVKRLEMHCRKELQSVEVQKAQMERERLAYIRQAREKEQEAMRAHLQSAHAIAQSKGDTQMELEAMKRYVLDQEKLRIDAEDQARESSKKSALFADRMRLLSEKLSRSQKEVKHLQQQRGSSASTSKRSAPVKQEDGEEEEEKDVKGKGRAHYDYDIALPTMSQARLDNEGFVELGSNVYRPTGQGETVRRRSKRFQPPPEEIVVLDSDHEVDFDDSNYPMPGFMGPSSAIRRRPTTPTSTYADEVATTTTKRQRSDRGRSSDSSLVDRVLSARQLAYGPRSRAR